MVWMRLKNGGNTVRLTQKKKQEIYGQLEQYCAMDTYAEYIVYYALEDMMRD